MWLAEATSRRSGGYDRSRSRATARGARGSRRRLLRWEPREARALLSVSHLPGLVGPADLATQAAGRILYLDFDGEQGADDQGPASGDYSVIYVGGRGERFAPYGRFAGLAEALDVRFLRASMEAPALDPLRPEVAPRISVAKLLKLSMDCCPPCTSTCAALLPFCHGSSS